MQHHSNILNKILFYAHFIFYFMLSCTPIFYLGQVIFYTYNFLEYYMHLTSLGPCFFMCALTSNRQKDCCVFLECITLKILPIIWQMSMIFYFGTFFFLILNNIIRRCCKLLFYILYMERL